MNHRFLPGAAALLLCVPAVVLGEQSASARSMLKDGFEAGLSNWVLTGQDGAAILDAGGEHGFVLRLRPNGDVHALVRGSEAWGSVAIAGEVLFPEETDSYLGVIYNYRERNRRNDFGLVYIKYGRSVYLQPNPHRDYNVSRLFYPEFVAPLVGDAGIRAGQWQRFRVEVVDGASHFYVGDLTTPQLTFPIQEPGAGLVGLQPRSVGGDVWVDNITVTSIDRFSYDGPPRPSVGSVSDAGEPQLRWEVLGPLLRTDDAVARRTGRGDGGWRPFSLDPRGAVETARVVDYHGPNTVAYFRTRVTANAPGPGAFHVSSIDDLALWVNGRFTWFIPRRAAAWFDFARNPEHRGERTPIDLVAGENVLVLRVRGGTYASGGFYARVERDGQSLAR